VSSAIRRALSTALLLWAPPLAAEPPATEEPTRAELLEEVQRLRERVERMEETVRRVDELEARMERRERYDERPAEATAPPLEGARQAEEPADPSITIGGALRFNAVWKGFDEDNRNRRGETGLDLFRINVDGALEDFLVSAEYRFYSFMNTIHHGWIGRDFDEWGRVEAGITKVPFGLLPYASHSFWFGIPYYIGLGDDYDLGVKYVLDRDAWNFQLAFFKNEELASAGDLGRYSYDLVTVGEARNEETNTVNARLAYTFGKGSGCSQEVGASGRWGELFNRDTDRRGDQWAAALHWDADCGRWNPQIEVGRYQYDPSNPVGVSDDAMTFGAFEAAHQVASEGTFAVANLAYNFPVPFYWMDALTCYNDLSVLHKDESSFRTSILNTTGCVVRVGPTYTYLDVIQGENALFLGDGSLAGDGSAEWETRLNLNVGYYW